VRIAAAIQMMISRKLVTCFFENTWRRGAGVRRRRNT
jgi:hypothetical protein